VPLLADAQRVLGDIGVAFGRPDVLAGAATALRDAATVMQSPRARLDADLLDLARRGRVDPSGVRAIAEQIDVSPVAARRATALRGGEAKLDAVDVIVLRAMGGEG
jgi:hypothetical protein